MPNQTVYYKVGNSAAMSPMYEFRTLNNAGRPLLLIHAT